MDYMNLTQEQVDALKEGSAVTLLPPEVGQECVLVLADTYLRLKRDFDPEDVYPAILEAWDSTGSPDDASYS